MERDVRWRDLRAPGLEQLNLNVGEQGVVVESVAVGELDGARFGLKYRIECAPDWSVRFAFLEIIGKPWALRLFHDGKGRWSDEFGDPVPELDGCLDLDIQATPFTNTLSIRRLGLAKDESRDITACHVSVPALEARKVTQRYTCLDPGRRYLYEEPSFSYAAELLLDQDGLVTNYPGLFSQEA